jgi:hypothetical protein
MNVSEFVLKSCILLLALPLMGLGQPQKGQGPKVDARIQMDKYQFNAGDALPLVLVLKNASPGDLTLEVPGLTSDSEYDEKQIVTCLKVISPKGEELAHNLVMDEPGPSLEIIDEKGRRQQVASVAVLAKDKAITVKINDLAMYFAVTEKGKYSVKAILPVAVHLQSFASTQHPNKHLGKTGGAEWSGVVESNAESFEIR